MKAEVRRHNEGYVAKVTSGIFRKKERYAFAANNWSWYWEDNGAALSFKEREFLHDKAMALQASELMSMETFKGW